MKAWYDNKSRDMKPAVVILAIVLTALQFAVADDFKTAAGKEYKDAKVRRVESDGIVVTFSGGIVKIPFTELSPEIQKTYGYDREAATADQSPAKIRITIWNLEWFPNGSAHDATQEVQAQRITAAADVLRKLNPDILLLQEMRDYDACARLGEAIQPGAYTVAICSAFMGGKQQQAIVAKIPAQAAWSEPWRSMEGIDPPRGFAFAWFKIGNADIGVYSLHLKSNRITRGNKEVETAKNIRKREVSIQQLLAHIHDVIGTVIPSIKGLIIGGDFNTNHDQPLFSAERTLDTLTSAAYQNVFDAIPFEQRITHPGSHGFPDATFDYVFGKNVRLGKPIITQTNASDHLPATVDVEVIQ